MTLSITYISKQWTRFFPRTGHGILLVVSLGSNKKGSINPIPIKESSCYASKDHTRGTIGSHIQMIIYHVLQALFSHCFQGKSPHDVIMAHISCPGCRTLQLNGMKHIACLLSVYKHSRSLSIAVTDPLHYLLCYSCIFCVIWNLYQ